MCKESTLDKSWKGEGDRSRVTRWTRMEASSVGVPADPTVGNDRKAGDRQYPVLVRSANPASEPNLREVKVEPVTAVQVTESRAAAAEIIRLGKVHGIDQDRAAEFVAGGKSVDEFSRFVLEEVAKRGAKPLVQPPAEGQERLDLSEKDQKEYNLARGLMTAVRNIENASSGGANRRENSFEMEISVEIEKNWKAARHRGLIVPGRLRHAWPPGLQVKFGDPLKKRAGLDSSHATA